MGDKNGNKQAKCGETAGKSRGATSEAVELGETVAAKLLEQGAAALLAREGRGTRA